jgi:hypothetical protein
MATSATSGLQGGPWRSLRVLRADTCSLPGGIFLLSAPLGGRMASERAPTWRRSELAIRLPPPAPAALPLPFGTRRTALPGPSTGSPPS